MNELLATKLEYGRLQDNAAMSLVDSIRKSTKLCEAIEEINDMQYVGWSSESFLAKLDLIKKSMHLSYDEKKDLETCLLQYVKDYLVTMVQDQDRTTERAKHTLMDLFQEGEQKEKEARNEVD